MTDPDDMTHHKPGSIAVLGCGLMGSSVARALANAGHSVSVWNRTSEKARALEDTPGIVAAESPADACRHSNLVVSVLEGYDVVREVLLDVPDLQGKTFVNLTTGVREDARDMQQQMEAANARYLEGTVLSYPQDIGAPHGLIVYSGPNQVFTEHLRVLLTLGGASRYVSAEIGGANVCAVVSSFFIAALAAFAESATYLTDNGIDLTDAEACAQSLIDRLSWQVTELVRAVGSSDFRTDQATIDAYASAATAFGSAVGDAGHCSTILDATKQVLARAQRAGVGHLAMGAVVLAGSPHSSA